MNEIEQLQRENIGKAIGVSVHPKISHAVALAGVAKHYFGGGVPMVIGGLLGYLIGSQSEVNDADKREIIQGILQSSQALQRSREQGVYTLDGEANDGIMSASDLMNFKYNKYHHTSKKKTITTTRNHVCQLVLRVTLFCLNDFSYTFH